MTTVQDLRRDLKEIFEPAIRWANDAPAERQPGDYETALSIALDLAWGEGWKVSTSRQRGVWTLSATYIIEGETVSAMVQEEDYIVALAELYRALVRRLDKVEPRLAQTETDRELAA